MTSSSRTVHDGAEPDLNRDEWARPVGRECEVPQEPAAPFRWLRRLPFRVRLTLSFAVVMIVLFGGLALLLQTQFSASLDQGINRSLHTHAADIASLVRGEKQLPQLPESGGKVLGIKLSDITGEVDSAADLPRAVRSVTGLRESPATFPL